jgi:alpha-mannosidase
VPVIWEAWDLDADWTKYLEEETRLQSTEAVSEGPECFVLRRIYRIGKSSTLTQDMIAYAQHRRIDFVTKVDWHETRRLLKVGFDSSIDTAQVRCEVQYGNLLRNTHQNLPQDRAKFEICAHKWISLEEAGSGIALLNDCKYGHDVSGGRMRLTLLRSPIAPDEEADQGEQRFTYALFPFAGSFAEAGVVHAAYELNDPVTGEGAATAAAAPAAVVASAADFSLLSIDNPAVILECLKAPELPFGSTGQKSGKALALRLYESSGGRAKALLRFPAKEQVAGVWETDMLERKPQALPQAGNELSLEFRPFEIKTLIVELG